jgi:hypothetical protein
MDYREEEQHPAPMTSGITMSAEPRRLVELAPRSLRLAICQAESAVNAIGDRLRGAEALRDELVRKLGHTQSQIDSFTSEKEYLSGHLRDLLNAADTHINAAQKANT